jgi:hypothetical protein
MAGIGIRLAQEVGAHRHRPSGHQHTVEDELWTRAFWFLFNRYGFNVFVMFTIFICRALICIDRATSIAVGRPCAIQEEECAQMSHGLHASLTSSVI